MTNLIEDITSLTDVSENILKKFVSTANLCICHSLHEARCENCQTLEVDIGIGKLQIKYDTSSISYRFVPSKELEQLMIKTLKTNYSPILEKLTNGLQEKIERAYKELL